MSIIKLPLLYKGSKSEKNLYTLFDSGANISCIRPEFAKDIADPIQLGSTRLIATASDGHYIEVKEAVLLDFYIDDVRLCDDFEHEQVIVDPGIGRLQLI
jgi:hypothetical protein